MGTTTAVVKFLQDKFEETGYGTVTDWMKANDVEISLQSATVVLLRGTAKGLVVMLTLASALGCTTDEMQWVAKECGDKHFWRLITPQVITKEHRQLIDDYDALGPEQRKIIVSMIKQMLPKE